MNKALIVGGNSGIGLALTQKLIEQGYKFIYIVGKEEPKDNDITLIDLSDFKARTAFYKLNLINENYEIFNYINDIDTLIITAGFGRVAPFEELTNIEISNLIKCNMLSAMHIIKHYYDKIHSNDRFYCAVMGSIAGHVVSPLFSVYGATKFGLCSFIENINAELAHDNYENRILDVSPGSLKGTNFNGTGNNMELISGISLEIIQKMRQRETLYIPQYDEIYKQVIEKYHATPLQYGIESYDYKMREKKINLIPQVKVGYLSGTFDLFHIGHLNLLKRAKEQCDYLIVGVHRSGSWKGKETYIPFEERVEIVSSVRYVDKVVESFAEDSDAYDAFHYDKLFVGSDYKGTERFKKYEEYFKEKGVQIVYFPYTQGTSSTQLREALSSKISDKNSIHTKF